MSYHITDISVSVLQTLLQDMTAEEISFPFQSFEWGMGKIKLGPIVFTSFWASLLSTNWQSTSLLWPLCRGGGGSQFYVRPCLKVTFTASVLHQSREQRNKESPWGGCKNAISRIINCLICSLQMHLHFFLHIPHTIVGTPILLLEYLLILLNIPPEIPPCCHSISSPTYFPLYISLDAESPMSELEVR